MFIKYLFNKLDCILRINNTNETNDTGTNNTHNQTSNRGNGPNSPKKNKTGLSNVEQRKRSRKEKLGDKEYEKVVRKENNYAKRQKLNESSMNDKQLFEYKTNKAWKTHKTAHGFKKLSSEQL